MDNGAMYFLKSLLAISTQKFIHTGLTLFYIWAAFPKNSVKESK